MVEVDLAGVTRRYGDVTALDDVSLRVADGEFFTLVGPSGCGKTTMLRAIAGFEEPDAGRVRFAGREMAGVPPEARDVGIVFQNYALFPHMSVAENVAYGLRFRDPPAGRTRRERVAELLELVDLSGFADRDPEQLSGGQQQRVALARALAPDPELLLLDEPMSALDARLRERLRLQVKRIQAELDVTTVYVTHDQEEALAVSDRVGVMNDGRVEQVDTPEAVYRRPASRFVASFVGENNVFEGRIVAREAGTTSVAVGDRTFRVREPNHDGANGTAAGVGERADGLGRGPSPADRMTFCVRPEALRADAAENRFTADVEAVEFLGEAVRVHLDWNGQSVTLRAAERPETGQVTVGFDPADAHVIPT